MPASPLASPLALPLLCWLLLQLAGPASSTSSSPIKHVVVLYLENRGFDHVLGFATDQLGVNGLRGDESNPFSLSDPSLGRLKVMPGAPFVATMDPNHGMPAYTLKIFGNSTYDGTSANGTCMNDCAPLVAAPSVPSETTAPASWVNPHQVAGVAGEATMEGFLPVEFDGEGYKHIERNKTEAQFVMQSFSPSQLPVTMALAENFAVFDR